MSPNKKLIETYLATTDKSKRGPLLADNVEWVEWVDGVPASGAITRGREAYLKNYGDDELRGEVHRLTEGKRAWTTPIRTVPSGDRVMSADMPSLKREVGLTGLISITVRGIIGSGIGFDGIF
ncbi:MAG: hypothetical protein WCA77_07225 [Thermoplasmata archaeon]